MAASSVLSREARSKEAELSKRLVELMRAPTYKVADIGGDPEREFEETFAGLSLVYIRDKAPRLMDYLVGFQLIERDDDNNRAVGAFVFRPGNLWILVYVFFLGGRMRGHEMFHVHNQDQFLPLKDRWINTLLAARSPIVGSGSSKDVTERGFSGPRLRDLVVPPNFGKSSGLVKNCKEFFKPFVAGLAKLATQNPGNLPLPATMRLEGFLEKSAEGRERFQQWGHFYPAIAQYAEARLGKNWFMRMGKEAHEKAAAARELISRPSLLSTDLTKWAEAAASNKLRILTELENNSEELSSGDREKYLRDGFLIRDQRTDKETSKAYRSEISSNGTNPEETGIFDVLTSARGIEKMLILHHPMNASGRATQAIVIDPDKSGRWATFPTNRIWARVSPLLREEFRDWVKGKSAGSLEEGSSVYIVVSEKGDSVAPFRVESSDGDGAYSIYFLGTDYVHDDDGDPLALYNRRRQAQEDRREVDRRSTLVLTAGEGAKLSRIGDVIYVPKDSCAIVDIGKPYGSDSKEPIEPTSTAGIAELFGKEVFWRKNFKKKGSLKVYVGSSECTIDNGRPTTKKQALFTLVKDWGFREDEAREMMKTAETEGRRGKQALFVVDLVKQAFGGPAMPDSDTMPTPPDQRSHGDPYGIGVNMMESDDQFQPMGMQMSNRGEWDPRAATPDPGMMGRVHDAVESGQHDLVDTSAINGLLQESSVENKISEFTSDLMKSVDRWCRILFMFYWHNDYFQQQYGKSSLPEMEDRIRNVIEESGDGILDLREKLRDIPGQESLIN